MFPQLSLAICHVPGVEKRRGGGGGGGAGGGGGGS